MDVVCEDAEFLDGYAQMPRMLAPPYTNQTYISKMDAVKKRRSQRANQSIIRDKFSSSLPPAKNLATTGASIAASPRNKP